MKKKFGICMFWVLPFFAFSQITYTPGLFNITVPAGFPPSVHTIRPIGRTSPGAASTFVFLEFGDGNFATSLNTNPAVTSPVFPHSFSAFSTTRRPPRIAFSAVYDPSPRPRRAVFSLGYSPAASGGGTAPPTALSGSANLAITTSTIDNAIASTDRQYIIALTYKVPFGSSAASLTFRHGSIFSVEGGPRGYNGESLSGIGAGMYSFTLPADGKEHNLFFTLNISPTTGAIANTTFLEATLNYNQNKVTKSLPMPLLLAGAPHDPNRLVSSPPCILINDSTVSLPIFYSLDFENDGEGNVKDSIVTKTFLPIGIVEPNDFYPIRIYEIKIAGSLFQTPYFKIKEENTILYNYLSDTLGATAQYIRPFLYVKIFKSFAKGTFYKDDVLPILQGAPGLFDSRSGFIKFSLGANVASERLIGWSSISFDSQREEYTQPSFSQFSRQCPCSCKDSLSNNNPYNFITANRQTF